MRILFLETSLYMLIQEKVNIIFWFMYKKINPKSLKIDSQVAETEVIE